MESTYILFFKYCEEGEVIESKFTSYGDVCDFANDNKVIVIDLKEE